MVALKVLGNGPEVAVGKVLCVGRNYLDHIRELHNPVPERPVLFLKPSSAIIKNGGKVVLPDGIGAVHHEVELGVIIGASCKGLREEDVDHNILGYNVLLDLTARDVQDDAKKKGLPWTVAKGYDTFAPMSEVRPREEVGPVDDLRLWLKVNGEKKQEGTTAQMMRPVRALIAYCSMIMTLERGDVIATGTPSGVGPIKKGDRLEAHIDKVGDLVVDVA
jgi:2-keto-4-pentenoate hydratase/2-oxohepta-3-ene-1,7-dioic acid hydratase in catechol pathway